MPDAAVTIVAAGSQHETARAAPKATNTTETATLKRLLGEFDALQRPQRVAHSSLGAFSAVRGIADPAVGAKKITI